MNAPVDIADPNSADPNSADPNSADLNSADLNRADLNRADPNRADPNRADLHSADLHSAERLDADAILAALPAAARARVAALEVAAQIDSTNSELLRRRTPADGVAVLFAERQSGGRGRHGRVWASPVGGNLYVSLARRFERDLAALGGLSLAVGIAAAEALHALGANAVRLKWPNDLVIVRDDRRAELAASGESVAPVLRKLGGVLIEGGVQDGAARAVIGLGVNLRMPTDAAETIDQPWTDVHALLGAATPPRDRVAAAVVASVVEALDAFDADGLAGFLPRYAVLDALYGREIEAEDRGRSIRGVAVGIGPDGALRLRSDDGERILHAGEVRVRAAQRTRRSAD
jgi:BirA family transcriptional regulator, biotin operon repressor / biotin---[acetyl-CoA-carboxylase] ligase